jgi:hypothetical protein
MVWNKDFFLVFIFLFYFNLCTYGNDNEYVIVNFKDKNLSEQDWSKTFSFKSLERRARQGLEFDYHDYPIQSKYLQSLTDSGFQVVNSSRWLNAALVLLKNNNFEILNQLSNFSFVKSVEFLGGKCNEEEYNFLGDTSYNEEVGILNSLAIKSIGLDTLHQEGYFGENITIAVVDAGFKELNHLKRFKHLYSNQILGERNFIDTSLSVYSESSHGTKVMSLFSCKNGNKLVGGSPEAKFWLLVSEDAYNEYPLEEFYFVKALEFSDSVGADIVNASIGYSNFDTSEDSYTTNDLYTKKSISSRASSIAASKGMIIVTSAGNEGNLPWREVTFPADADSIIAVGATNLKGVPAYYASYGRGNKKLIRPNFSAPGDKVYTLNETGKFVLSYGSSYAAPLISSAIACLWEKYPHIKAFDLIQYLEQTAQNYSNPNLQTGYGFPDLKKLVKYLDASENK